MALYANSETRNLNSKFGEGVSIFDFIPTEAAHQAIRDGTSVVDMGPIFQTAVDSVNAAGGGWIQIPWGRYQFDTEVLIPADVHLFGEGDNTLLVRNSDLTNDTGLLTVNGDNVSILALRIDGAVTTAVGKAYGTGVGQISEVAGINGNPIHPDLSKNSSIWIKSGFDNVRIEGVSIFHTGGYAIVMDARTADINGVSILHCKFDNNRPHLFGSPGDLNYGSWTGGILAKGDGATGAVKNLKVRGCVHRRCTGNQIWSHLDAFTRLHENVTVMDCSFEDIGLDCIQMGGVNGFTVTGNSGRRIGHVAVDDVSTAPPKYLAIAYAVFIDNSGWCRGTITGNSVMSINGGFIDLDGFHDGTVTGNTGVVPGSEDLLFTIDDITNYGLTGNVTKGIQTGNTFNNLGARRISITGNQLVNMAGGGIVLKNARDCLVQANNIVHPTVTSDELVPIMLFNTGAGVDNRAHDNVVTGNTIQYTQTRFSILELDTVFGSTNNFAAGDVNHIYNNRIKGTNKGEFRRSPNSGSATSLKLTSVDSGVTDIEETIIQREGTGAGATTKIYKQIGAVSTQMMSIIDVNNFMNVSAAGAAGTGGFATGTRTSAAFDDTVFTGHVILDAFLSVVDYLDGTLSTYADADANLLGDEWGLLRFDRTGQQWQQSITTSGGVRVWETLTAKTDPGGADKDIQFNDAAILAGDSNLQWDKTLQRVSVTGLTTTASIVTTASFIQSAEGFLTNSTSTSAIQAPNGGVTAQRIIGTISHDWLETTAAIAVVSALAQARIYMDSTSKKLRVSENAGAYVDLVTSGGSIGGANTQIQYNSSGAFAGSAELVWDNTLKKLTVDGIAATVGLKVIDGFVDSDGGFLTTSTSTQAVQATGVNAGVFADRIIADRSHDWNETTAALAVVSAAGQSRIYMDSTSNKLRASENAGAYVDLVTLGGSIGGSNTQVQYNSSGAFAGSAQLVWDNTLKKLTVDGIAATVAIKVIDGFVDSDGGFLTTSTSTQAIQATGVNAGVFADRIIADRSHDWNETTSALAALSVAGQSRIYMDSTSNKLRVSENGAAYVDLITAHTVPGGSNTQVQYNSSGAFAGSTNFEWVNASQRLDVAGINATAAINVSQGFIQSEDGFLTTSTSTAAIHASGTNAGVTADRIIGDRSHDWIETTAALAALSTAGQSRIYMDSTSNKLRVSENAGAYVDLISASSGITTINSQNGPAITINGTANQVIVTTGTDLLTLSCPQNIHTTADPTFDTLTLNNFGSSALNVSNGGIIVDDDVNCGRLTISGTLGIDGSRNATLAAITGTTVDVSGNSDANAFRINGITVVSNLRNGTLVALNLSSTATNALDLGTGAGGGIQCKAIAVHSTAFNAIEAVAGGIVSDDGYWVGANQVILSTGAIDSPSDVDFGDELKRLGSVIINTSGAFVSSGGVSSTGGIGGSGFNFWNGASFEFGVTSTQDLSTSTDTLTFKGGVLVLVA